MITLNRNFNGADWPITIEKDELIAFFMVYKGKGIDLIKSLLTELKKDKSDIVKLELKEIEKLLKSEQG